MSVYAGLNGALPPGSPEAALSWYQAVECGQGWQDVYGAPFWELPEEVRDDLTYIMENMTGTAARHLVTTEAALQAIASRGSGG